MLFVAALVGCSSPAPETTRPSALGDDAITVGSFNFAESRVLAEIYSQALEGRGYQVRRAFDLGAREFVAPALAQGMVEFLPEYAGTALQFLSLGKSAATSDVASTHDALMRAAAERDMAALASAPAQDANAFVVTRETADREELRTVSDLAAAAPRLTFGGPPECQTRTLCLVGLRERYGARFKDFVALDTGGPSTRQALQAGYVDVALLFTTDPALVGDEFVELRDDQGLQPAENVTPLVRREIVDRWGSKVVEVIDRVSSRLTTAALRAFNAQMARDGATARSVAARWLRAERLP